MKKLILGATVATIALASSAFAADPRAYADREGAYLGANIGSTLQTNSQVDLGLVAGYQVMPYARVEATYDYAWFTQGNAQMLMANAIAQYRIEDTQFTPYVLAGAGFGFNNYGTANNLKTDGTSGIYNVGGGIRAAVTENVDLDLRYRYVGQFDDVQGRKDTNVITVGAAYRF